MLFGPPISFDFDRKGIVVEEPYLTDSVVLCPKDDRNAYYTFYIRCIDADGNRLNLE
jgi:hypothetical protein